jgi:alpha-beta hydrolase superfamily lysophospholipase
MTKRRIASAAAALVLGALAGPYAVGWTLSRPFPAHIGSPPASLDAEPVAFSSQSGSVIHGWLSRAPSARGSLLLLPGVRANRLSMVRRAEFLREAGYSTLLIDFQATGESDGEVITFGWRERFDVLAAVQYLKTRMPGQPVGIIGVSLGGAAATLAASSLHVNAAVLEAVYPSIDRALVNRLETRIGPLGSVVAPFLLFQLQPRLGITAADLTPVDHIAQFGCPLLVVGGSADRYTTVDDTQRLFAAAREPKDLWMIPGAAHVDLLEFAGDAYRHRILAFFASALGKGT